ncbi:MAG TPA: hypothetical protein VGN00_24910 [Puia sp.]
MVKYPVTILLLLLIALQTFSKWCLIAEFRINRDFIAKNLCVNRLTPYSCCKGKCYLNKKMAADESQQQVPGKGSQRDETLLQVHKPGNLLPEPVFFVTVIHHSTPYRESDSQDWPSRFFTPPRTISLI